MPKKAVRQLIAIASPNIEETLARFLNELVGDGDITESEKKGSLRLFLECMNSYAHQSLNRDETALFEHYYNIEGKHHKEFCQLFGPEKIAESVSEYVGWYLIAKVMLTGEEMSIAAKAVSEFCNWLAEGDIAPVVEAKKAAEQAERAARLLPCAEDANRLIWEVAQKCPKPVEGFIDFGHMNIKKIENDCLWLQSDEGSTIGPVVAPKKALMMLKAGWTINCALTKSSGKWHFSEVGNVYPADI